LGRSENVGDDVILYRNKPGFMAFLCREIGGFLHSEEIADLGKESRSVVIFYDYDAEGTRIQHVGARKQKESEI